VSAKGPPSKNNNNMFDCSGYGPRGRRTRKLSSLQKKVPFAFQPYLSGQQMKIWLLQRSVALFWKKTFFWKRTISLGPADTLLLESQDPCLEEGEEDEFFFVAADSHLPEVFLSCSSRSLIGIPIIGQELPLQMPVQK